MAKLDNVSDVFANATVGGGNLTTPTGDLPRFNQGNNVAEGAEVVYALLAAMHSAVNAAGNENTSVSAGVSNTFNASALTMNRAFTFTTTLDVSAKLDDFDVKLDSNNIVPNLTLEGVSPATYTVSSDDSSTNISAITLTSDGASVNASSTDFTVSAASNVDGNWTVVNDGGAYKLRLSDEVGLTAGGQVHVVTVSVEDNRLGFDQFPAITATVNVTVNT